MAKPLSKIAPPSRDGLATCSAAGTASHHNVGLKLAAPNRFEQPLGRDALRCVDSSRCIDPGRTPIAHMLAPSCA
eukprot:8123360-Pyramimonas_sp.AAC.1